MIETLLSVPPSLKAYLHSRSGSRLWAKRLQEVAEGPLLVSADPGGRRLGSGGGTLNLLVEAWRRDTRSRRMDLFTWFGEGQRLVLHSGGESRRLPAYAGIGKAFMPLPRLKGLPIDRFDQRLFDVQVPTYRRVLAEAGSTAAALVTSGDVWLDFNPLSLPRVDSDIVGIGMRVPAEVARHFGVFFVTDEGSGRACREQPIARFLQKPSLAEIQRLAATHEVYVDTGMWLLSARALRILALRCGWDHGRSRFKTPDGHPLPLDLYTEVGAGLGKHGVPDARLKALGWSTLSTAVIALTSENARFFHLGSSRQLFESMEQLQEGLGTKTTLFCAAASEQQITRPRGAAVWVDGLAPDQRIAAAGANLLTGLPRGSSVRRLRPDHCIDAAPIGATRYGLRPYHTDDTLRGHPGRGGRICGIEASVWLEARGFDGADQDVFELPLYPLVPARAITQETVEWFFSRTPDPRVSRWMRAQRRLSAAELPNRTNFGRLFAERGLGYAHALRQQFDSALGGPAGRTYTQDFSAISAFCRNQAPALGAWLVSHEKPLLKAARTPEHRSRLLVGLSTLGGSQARRLEAFGYAQLQRSILFQDRSSQPRPTLALKEDQIVWGRSPVRLDLAGGWTDTPPYCFEHGGCVVNVAVLLNGQPPIQAFLRPLNEPRFRLRSIDLGSSEDVTSYAQLESYGDPKAKFSLAKAALSLAGFHPRFTSGRPFRSLAHHLRHFGCGLEVSLLSAVPKGSGLGTSSILGATLLGALNRACGLGWDEVDLYNRVLSLEQLLTTGGGWQDQAGALFRGIKRVETLPGPAQTPSVRYFPEHLLGSGGANDSLLLYYTGVTRMAKSILREIVQDMFLRKTGTLRTLSYIRANADALSQALADSDREAFTRCIARSWDLNQQLDRGTSTPEVERIIALCGPDLVATKLLGAGGGGYMLLCARDPEASRRLKQKLERHPPNPRARFIAFQVAERALEVTVS